MQDGILDDNLWLRGQVILEPGDMLDVPKGLVHYAQVVSKEPCTFFDSSR